MEPNVGKPWILDLSSKVKKLTVTDVVELNSIIDQLNAYQSFDVLHENKVIEDLLGDLSKVLPPKNDHLLSKFCSLLYYLLHKQKIEITSCSFELLFPFITHSLRSCGEWVQNDVLIALSAVLGKADHFEKFYADLVGKDGVLVTLLSENNHDKSVQLNAFQCLLNLVQNLGENQLREEVVHSIYQKCLLVLKEKFVCNTSDILTLKIIISSLKCIQHLFESKITFAKNMGELLGTLKSLLFYGLPGQSFMTDINLQPTLRYPDGSVHFESQSESDSPFPKLRKQKRNKRRAKKTPQKGSPEDGPREGEQYPQAELAMDTLNTSLSNASITPSKRSSRETWIRSSSSDSELSDVESRASKMRGLQSQVRQNAYLGLQAVVKTSDKKVVFGYWSSFLPEHPTMPGIVPNQNIFTTILKDPIPQVRLCALNFLAEILNGSKQFLSLADGRNVRQMSFTSLSSILAMMIVEIHRCLLLTLLSETSNLLLTQILKCYAVLAENVPYVRLNKEILKYLKHIKAFLYHKDVQVQVASLTVFGAIINSDQTPAEIEELMLSEDFELSCSILNTTSVLNSRLSQKYNDQQIPWIIELCHKNIFDENPLPVKIQSLQLLSNTTGKYFTKSKPFFSVVYNIVFYCVDNPDTIMQLHGLKFLDILGRCMSNTAFAEHIENVRPMMSTLWKNILSGPFIKCLTNEELKTIQSVCCDCLSSLPASDFELIPPRQQILYITILLGLAADSNPNVRGAAIRCLGLFCMFPCLTQDPSFLNDVSVILVKSVEDSNINVRLKASWSLGNLSEALFLNRDQLQLSKEISPQFFHSAAMACVKFSKDNDRVKANSVRALGNFLNYIPQDFIDLSIMQEFIQESCQVLKSALKAGFMKVCWNSCYAVRNMFKNVYLIDSKKIDLEDMLNCLLQVLKSPNFKVRISAAQALTSLPSREHYGSLYPEIWKCLVSALMSISADVNFKEVKHQENLCDQLCLSLCQLTVMISLEDSLCIIQSVLDSKEILLTSMWKFGSQATEEKNLTVSTAVEKLLFLKKDTSSSDEESILTTLLDIFNQSIIAFYEMADNDFVKN